MGYANKGNGFVWDVALKESLSLNHERVSIIRCNAGSKYFITWFHISCYFPVFTACLGPIANTISIACVVERWRLTSIHYIPYMCSFLFPFFYLIFRLVVLFIQIY